MRVYDTVDGTNYVEKGSDVHRPLGVIRRLGLGTALAGAAIWVAVLGCAVPAQAAVDLVYFQATGYDDHVLIEWGTAQELNNAGFKLYREYPELGQNRTLIPQVFNSQCMGTVFGCEYSYEDDEVQPGITYHYWLESLNLSGGSEFYGPVAATPGPSPTPTSTSAPTETATSTPTATPTSTPTRVPTATRSTVPTATPSFTATGAPTFTPAGTPTTTAVSPPSSSPSPTFVVEQRLSPTVTPGGMAQPTLTPGPVYGERTPTPTSTRVAGASETPRATSVAWGGDSEPGATGWSSLLVHWPTIQPSTILLLISLVSLLGVLLLSVALALVRKLSL